jgi:hypothetical protein
MWRVKFHLFGTLVIIKPRALIITGHWSDSNAIILNW